uniref:Small ribosomal subunit protein uS3m n=1 Tax=Hygrophorus russula TaxID=264141 RepID=A0A346LZM1_9AGAR|nr:ribosomal protein S3 [Hygrophorus russula]AXQ02216.1 ribosomal protein S3 [Hygrophorus russula]
MINNTIKISKISPLLKNNNNISNQIKIDNETNISNTILDNINYNNLSFDELLKLYIKGLKIYTNDLISYNLKWNNKKLIINIKNKALTTISNNKITEEENNKSIIKNKTLNLNTKSVIEITNNLASAPLETTNDILNTSNYQKSITIFNSIPKGKLFTFSQQLIYNFNSVNNKLIKKMYTFLFYSFFSMNSLISKPILEITPNKVIINLIFFHFDLNNSNSKINNRNKSFKGGTQKELNNSNTMDNETIKKNKFININHKKLDLICKILSIYFKKPVELHLVKLNYPYLDSNIFVNLLGLMINNKKIRHIMKRFFRFAVIKNIAKSSGNNLIRINKIPSFLSGIKIKIAGRLLTQRVVPRKTVKIIRRGAFARGKVNFLDIARYTSKNKRGAFSITVTTGQNIII